MLVSMERPSRTPAPVPLGLPPRPIPATPPEARKGRGATVNPSGRFERYSREAFADGYVSKAKGVRGFVTRIEELVARSLGGQA